MFDLIHRKLDVINAKLDAIIRHNGVEDAMLSAIRRIEERTMASIDDLVTEVAQEKTDIASMQTFIAGIEKQLADALAGATLSPANQAKVDQLFTDLKANDAAIVSAIQTPGT